MEQSGTPREREHQMTLTPSGTLSMKDPTWRMGSNHWSTIYMFTKSFPTDSKSLQSLLELPTESISSQENPCPPQNHPGDGGLLFLTWFQVSQTMTPCTRAADARRSQCIAPPFVSVKSFPGEERDRNYIPTTPPETFLTLPQVLPPSIGKF